jgi:hypothetical protein
MKRVLILALSALMILPVSCDKTQEEKQSQLVDPATKELAKKISFTAPVAVGALNINSIELTEASRYIIEFSQTKADWGAEILYGTYSYANDVFSLHGFGDLRLSGNVVTISLNAAGASPVQAEANINPVTTSTETGSNACRNWGIGKVILGMSGGEFGQAGMEKVFKNGIDMKEIGEWASQYFPISQEDMAAIAPYSVKEICMTGSGSFVLAFKNADPFYGFYTLSGSNFSYTLNENDIPFISGGKVSGSVTFEGSTCKIEATATAVYNQEKYNATLEMELHELQ